MLTKRERVHATIRRSGLDAIPWQFNLTSAVKHKLEAHYGPGWHEAIGEHVVYVNASPYPGLQADVSPDVVRNEFGALWRRSARDYAVGDFGELVDYPLKSPSLEGYAFPDGHAPGRWDHLAQVRAQYPDHFLVA